MSRTAAPNRQIWIDGRLKPWPEATVHLLCHSLQRGSLVFDYMSVHETPRGPAIFRLPEHIVRFRQSLELVGLPLERDPDELREAVLVTVRVNPGASVIKISAYLPSLEVDVVPADDRVELAIAAYDPQQDVNAHKPHPPRRKPELHVRLDRQHSKLAAGAVPPQAKVAANYLGPMIAKWAAFRAGFDEVLLVDGSGHLAEGPTTNVFLVDTAGTLLTPPVGAILEGITRSSVLELAKHDGRAVRETPIEPDALFDAAEVFLTGTSAGVWPVVTVDGQAIATGQTGPVAKRLRQRLSEVASGADPAFAHWLTWLDGR